MFTGHRSSSILQLYSINLINPSKKSEGVIKKLRGLLAFTSVHELTQQICEMLKSPTTQIQLGYYEPGHGAKGKKRYITDDDIEEMKMLYDQKKEVLLWCYDPFIVQSSNTKKRQRTDESDNEPKVKSRSRFENALEKKMTKVEETFEALQKKHGSSYKPEQFWAWANMIQMQKHTSLEEPPPGRFFKTTRIESDNTSASKVSSVVMSPIKRLSLRSQCIEQLEKWHRLMESGAISKEQYDELQIKLFSDIKKY